MPSVRRFSPLQRPSQLLVLGLAVLLASSAQATTMQAVATYVNEDPPFDTVLIEAQFDDAGISGTGTELVQVTSLFFTFALYSLTQAPLAIVLSAPPYPQGTFLAQYQGGVFEAIVSAGGAGGFAQPAARVDPSRINLVKEYISMGVTGGNIARLSELFEFSGLAGVYELDLNVGSYTVTEVPEPGTAALVVVGLGALAASGRRRTT